MQAAQQPHRTSCTDKRYTTGWVGADGGQAKGFEADGALGTEELHEKHRAEFASIDEALQAMARGEFVVVLDDEDRENEGDLIIAADKMTPEAMGFMVSQVKSCACATTVRQTRRAPQFLRHSFLVLLGSKNSPAPHNMMLSRTTISVRYQETVAGGDILPPRAVRCIRGQPLMGFLRGVRR